ncbi:MAG TPA: hypothetical protein VN867_12610 [Candidatus Binataceae bacterium]|nr:hypothetical protein [Candidatus Binataceae bacterium]
MEQATSELSERLSRLEYQQAELRRTNQRWRMISGALFLLCGALVTMAQSTSGVAESLDARQFVLHDSTGKVRGALGITDDGAVGLNFVDSKDRTRISLDVASNGTPGLDLYDQDGKLRGLFAVGTEGAPGVGLYGPDGHLRTSLDVPAGKIPGLAFYHDDGKPAWGAP